MNEHGSWWVNQSYNREMACRASGAMGVFGYNGSKYMPSYVRCAVQANKRDHNNNKMAGREIT